MNMLPQDDILASRELLPMNRTRLSMPVLGASAMLLIELAGPAGAQSWLFRRPTTQPAAPVLYWTPVTHPSTPAAATTATGQPPAYVAPALAYYPVVPIAGYTYSNTAVPALPAAYPVAPRSYLAGYFPDVPAMPAVGTSVGVTVAQELGAFLLDRLRQRLAGQGTGTTTTDQASQFKDLLDQALSLFAQRTGGYQPNADDLRTIVDLVIRVLGERSGASISTGGSAPSSLTINASTIQVTIPPTANIFLQPSGGAKPADNAQPPPATQAGDAMGESGPPAVR
jgi:hypothetical protein